MSDWDTEVMRLIREAVPGVKVYDGQPAAKLEDRPELHLIVDINVPVLQDDSITSGRDAELVKFQVRTIVRSGGETTREDAAWVARWHSRKVRNYLVRQRLRSGGQLIDHVLQTGMVDDQAIVAHSTQIQVSQFEARA